jgi:hypothetical protein
MNDRDTRLFNLGNKFQDFIDSLEEGKFSYLQVTKRMWELMNELRIACYSEEHKKSTRYFMTEMTQQEFDEFASKNAHFKINVIKKPF